MSELIKPLIWEKRFKDTADLLPGIICEADLTMRVTYANEFAYKTFKYNAADIEKGVFLTDLIHPEDRERATSNVFKLTEGEAVGTQEYRLVHKDGGSSVYQISSAPMRDGDKIVGIRTCIMDIGERKKAEEEMRASEQRFRSIFLESPIGIAIFDEKGSLQNGNLAFQSMFGDKKENADELSLFALASLSKEEIEALKNGDTVRCGLKTIDREIALEGRGALDTDAKSRYLEWTISRIRGKNGDVGELNLAQVQDVTERRAAEQAELLAAKAAAEKAEAMVRSLRQEVRESFTFSNMVSRSNEMKKIFDLLPQAAAAPATVLVLGESGTGKELIARALHQLSPRKRKPFVAVNCSALPDNLLESELFGYKAGAFTDAKRDKPGKLALAEGGVLFLDEIGDISPAVQVKLLRVLQERTFEPLGGVESIKADVRIIAATHQNLVEMVEQKRFREDLFYRINVLKIKLPPLRERRMDIPLLIDHFISLFNARYGKEVEGISQAALNILMAHDFNGNVRELENIIEHAFVFCEGREIRPVHLPEELRGDETPSRAALREVGSFDELAAHYLRAILDETGGSRIEAARRLGVHKSTLFRKLKKLGIE